MHLELETLERLAGGDVGPAAAAAAERHLAACAECSERLDDVRVLGLLTLVDDVPPAVDVDALIARARAPRGSGLRRWAAAIALTLGAAGAVYAAPGSPVPAWVATLSGRAAPPDASVPPGAAPDVGGIVVAAGGRLVVELGRQPAGTLTLLLVEGVDCTVEAVGAPASFDSRTERLLVSSTSSPDYRISVPRGAPDVEILVGSRSVFRARSGRVETLAAAAAPGVWTVAFDALR